MKTWGRLALFLFFAAAAAFAGGGECGDETIDAGEECDDGAANGNSECGCTEECTWRSEGTECGDSFATECDLADVCDGFGSCVANYAAAGTFCGDSLGDECTDPDTCDDFGVCLSNNVGDGTLCTSDTIFCNGAEICLSGACTSPGDPCDPGQSCNESTDVCEATLLLDIDADGEIKPLTDGVLMLRHLFGFTGNVLIDDAVDTFNCNRCSAEAIDSYLDDLRSASSALL